MEQALSTAGGKLHWKQLCLGYGLPCLYVAAGICGLQDYLRWTSPAVIITIAGLPMLLSGTEHGRRSQRFGIAAFFLLAALWWLPVRTLLYAAWGCALLYLYEQRRGRVTILPVLALLLMSPMSSYLAGVFSFPIRLWLTDIAGGLLSSCGLDAGVEGNIIVLHRQEYSVDPACMGLNMLVVSLLCGLVMIGAFQRRYGRVLSWYQVLLLLAVLFLLNIAANLVRILLLVYLQLMPDNPMHELTGIICMAVYVLLPGWWLTRRAVRLNGRPMQPVIPVAASSGKGYSGLLSLPLLLAVIFMTGHNPPLREGAATLPGVPGYVVSRYDEEVIRAENGKALIYVKDIKGFFFSEHNPLICWTACGYTFSGIQRKALQSVPVYMGVLHKGKETLYTAWWYDNGTSATVSQWRWRWDMLLGAPSYHIINVTAADPATLNEEAARAISLRRQLIAPGGN